MKTHLDAIAIFFVLGLMNARLAFTASSDWYKRIRNQMLEYEQLSSFGGNIELTPQEEMANMVLMRVKKAELEIGFLQPRLFAPSRNFLLAAEQIKESPVFKIIQQLPKGAVLHSHDTAIVSLEYIFNNITYRDNLYVCESDGTLHLRFFDQPDRSCNWELLSDVRADPLRVQETNRRILGQMSMTQASSQICGDVDSCWRQFQNIFMFITPMLSYRPVFEDHFYRGLQELYEDNVMYIELRSTLPQLYDLDGRTYSERELVTIYRNTTERFKQDHPDFIGAKVIYAPLRAVDRATAARYVATMTELHNEFPDFVAGFDLVGQEDKGKTLEHFSDLLGGMNKTIKFFFHAAETNWLGMSTDENLFDAILLNAKRIGHGYALHSHPFLLDIIKRTDIGIEVNPISNQVLGLVGDLRNHAARSLFAAGYPLIISNDDPGLWGARALSYDFYEAFMALMSARSDLKALKQLAKNSIMYSTLNSDEKDHFLAIWERQWNNFVHKIVNREGINC